MALSLGNLWILHPLPKHGYGKDDELTVTETELLEFASAIGLGPPDGWGSGLAIIHRETVIVKAFFCQVSVVLKTRIWLSKRREMTPLDRQETQQQRPEWPMVSPPGMRVNTRDINSTKDTSSKKKKKKIAPSGIHTLHFKHTQWQVCTCVWQNQFLFKTNIVLWSRNRLNI